MRNCPRRGYNSTMRACLRAVLVAASVFVAPGTALASDVQTCLAASEQAQSLRDDGAYMKAREQLLVCTRDVCPAVVRKACAEWMTDVDASIPSVIVNARDAQGKDLSEVTVMVDGKPFTERLDGRPLPIDPGRHRLRYEAQGAAPVEEDVVIHAGEKRRVLPVKIVASAKAVDPTAAGVEPVEVPHGGNARTIVGLGAIGVGLLGVGVGAVFGLQALSKSSDAKSLCPSSPCTNPDAGTESRSAVSMATVSTVAFGVGLAALAVGAYLTLTSTHAGKKGQSTALGVTPVGFVGTW